MTYTAPFSPKPSVPIYVAPPPKLTVQLASTCALSEIRGLYQFSGKAKEAMKSFHANATYNKACLVVFHGVVENHGSDTGWCPNGCEYIQEFTAYIREHKLGVVIEGAKAENVRYHPGHVIQANVWAPDYPAIDKWALNEKGASIK